MTRGQRAFWALFAVTMAVYVAMLAWSLPTVSAAAGGLRPFDMRPGGYTFEDARTFLTALSPEGASFYKTVQHRLDLFYPALIAATLFFALASLLPPQLGAWRWFIAAPAVLVAAFDYAENAAVAAMLDAGAALSPDMVQSASEWTVWKTNVTTAVMLAVLALLLWRGVVWWRARR